MQTQTRIEVPLSQLKIDPANVRHDGTPDPSFIASISAKGIIVPLIARKNGDGYLVTAGGKRLASVQELLKRGATMLGDKVTSDTLIKIEVRDDDELGAIDTSLTENYIRDDMHPADKYEAFAKLQTAGMSKEDIRKRYNLKPKEMEQVLALGALSPAVREAWKADKIRDDSVTAFTLEPDHARQDAILKKLGKWPNRWQVRQAIVGDSREYGQYLAFVTAEAYEAAGGKIIKDLFAGNHETDSHVSDTALLKRLVDEKIKAECDKLIEEGFAWAEFDDGHQRYSLDHIDHGKKPTKEDKAKAGCMVYLDHNGKMGVEKWLTKSKAAAASSKAKATKAAGEKAKPSNALSNALKQRLASQLLKATQQALIEDTKDSGLDTALAKIVAAQITPDRANYMPRAVSDGLANVRANLTPKIILAAIIKNFDAKDYFSSAPKGVVAGAIKEAGFTDTQFKAAGKTKADTWKFAVANVTKTGWLPKELRGDYYTGPSKAPAAKKKAR